jgi:Fur family transcriptional regulator, stress-responsive regulator
MPVDHVTVLREQGLRVTKQRVAVMSALSLVPHSGADTVLATVRGDVGQVSTQAVYDVLNTLTDHGIVRRIQPAGSSARYELRVGDNHHHLVCRDCDATYDVDCVVGSAPCLTHTPVGDFVVDEAEVIFWGRCPDCAARINPPHPAHPNTTDQHPH